jgi:hypothetical protein
MYPLDHHHHRPSRYRMLDLGGGGLFLELGKRAMATNNSMELDEAIR